MNANRPQAASHIGLAGYMGSGKSTIAGLLTRGGYVVIDADREAKGVMEHSTDVRAKLADTFGDDVLSTEGIDFRALGAKVFQDLENLRKLNTIAHPPLLEHLRAKLESLADKKTVLDAALLPLWNHEAWFAQLWWVDCNRETRLQRVHAKTGLPQDTIRRRMDKQEQLYAPPPSPPWIRIVNDGDLPHLEETVAALLGAPAKS
ncbi:MAG: dephospho-CoA kinase [Chitinivibrionales bacterium]|nr:dephospho-CoA kinase [Chitinivibrionales bacterium]